jgi:hypothetical protein
MFFLIPFSIQSNTVKTEIIDTMPIVMPKRDRKVRSLLPATELKANRKLSLNIFNHMTPALIFDQR